MEKKCVTVLKAMQKKMEFVQVNTFMAYLLNDGLKLSLKLIL